MHVMCWTEFITLKREMEGESESSSSRETMKISSGLPIFSWTSLPQGLICWCKNHWNWRERTFNQLDCTDEGSDYRVHQQLDHPNSVPSAVQQCNTSWCGGVARNILICVRKITRLSSTRSMVFVNYLFQGCIRCYQKLVDKGPRPSRHAVPNANQGHLY